MFLNHKSSINETIVSFISGLLLPLPLFTYFNNPIHLDIVS
nr:MAG TPA: hypothetical protein [Caudoviricetes sp.]